MQINEELPASPVGLFEADQDGRVVAANPTFVALVGGSAPVLGETAWAAAAAGERAAAQAAWQAGTRAADRVRLTFAMAGPSGAARWVRLDAQATTEGAERRWSGAALDDTEATQDRQLLERLLTAAGGLEDAVLVFDGDGTAVYANPAAMTVFGVGAGPGGTEGAPAPAPAQAAAVLEAVRDQVPRHVLTSTESARWTGEIGLRTPDGLEHTVRVDVVVHRRDDGVTDHWTITGRDVSDDRRVQAELARQATHDAHTGLPNRVYLLRLAAAALERSRETRADVAIVFIDVDRLKEVNDTVGHDAGDALLANIGSRLSHAIRPSDVVGRIGGDEFAVLCEGEIDEHTAIEIGERLRLAVSGMLTTHGVEVELSASIGVAVAAGGTFTGGSAADAALALLRHADTAMYLAKRRGRSRVELYTEAMRTRTEATRRLTGDLERALAAEELFVVYQPVIAVHSGRTVGAEALLRWRHPDRGVLLPADFLALAERSGAIVPIGDWVLRTACADAGQWIADGLLDRSFSVHVNVSARQLAEREFVDRVRATLQHADVLGQQLTVDVGEGAVSAGRRALQALRRAGVRIALDGFAGGTSSLTALRDSDADVLKLDGHVTESLDAGGDEDPLIRAIVQLAHALNMEVVAQWVRRADQVPRLRLLGCDMVQGNLYGEPATAADFAARARR